MGFHVKLGGLRLCNSKLDRVVAPGSRRAKAAELRVEGVEVRVWS